MTLPAEYYVFLIESIRGREVYSLLLTDGSPPINEKFYDRRVIKLPLALQRLSLDEIIDLYKQGFIK